MPALTLLKFVHEQTAAEGGVFGPDEIAVMATAFDQLVRDFKLTEGDDAVVGMLAKLVIELARNGVTDPKEIRKQVLGKHGPG